MPLGLSRWVRSGALFKNKRLFVSRGIVSLPDKNKSNDGIHVCRDLENALIAQMRGG